MKAPQANPNPAGKHGKPISLAPYSFDDALRKILQVTPRTKRENANAKSLSKRKVSAGSALYGRKAAASQ